MKLKVAVAQAASIIFDLEKTVKKTIKLIKKAAKKGEKLLVLLEVFIEGYPQWGLSFGQL